MNKAIISIPNKYAEGLNPIILSLKNHLSAVGVEVELSIAGQNDIHEITQIDSPDLDPRYYDIIQSAIDYINSELIHSPKDPWQTEVFLEETFRANLEAIDRGLDN